jgi:peptide deformylase
MASTTPTHEIRIYGDPVLKAKTPDVTDIDGKLVRLAEEMVEVMYAAPGIGCPPVGVQKRFFVYDLQDGPARRPSNPVIQESRGGSRGLPVDRSDRDPAPEGTARHRFDLDGNELQIEADESSTVIQHELDASSCSMHDARSAQAGAMAPPPEQPEPEPKQHPADVIRDAGAGAGLPTRVLGRRPWPCPAGPTGRM